ncbi:transposase [Clostridia bacterium]|nr:transposase [Clostridia bacterium]
MAVFRVEKNKGYTVMSNHHLRNAALSLKAKGLLSQMLSLPEDWDYTLKGLSQINRESLDAIRTAVQELERAGYITRSRERNEKGQLCGAEYVIREQPTEDVPTSEEPISENPTLEKATQLNKDKLITEKPSKDLLNIESIRSDTDGIAIYRDIIKDNIEYPIVTTRHSHAEVDEIVDLILETVCTSRKTIHVAGDDYPTELVKSKLLRLNSTHIDYVFECLQSNTMKVRNIKKYLLATLFNAPSTIDSYYSAAVRHDLYGGNYAGRA